MTELSLANLHEFSELKRLSRRRNSNNLQISKERFNVNSIFNVNTRAESEALEITVGNIEPFVSTL